MSWNPQYDQIGKTFVQQYYTCFDDPTQRASVAAFYDEEKSLMTFEDQQLFGRTKIMEKIQSGGLQPSDLPHRCTTGLIYRFQKYIYRLPHWTEPNYYKGLTFQKIAHMITAIDTHPMFDGGILICVLGQLKTDDDPPHTFHQTFVLKSLGESFYVEHDIFRLALHHIL